MQSKKFTLNRQDLIKLLTGLGLAIGGVILTYLQEMIPQINFGGATPVVVALNSVLINLARKWITDKKNEG
ncbi:MAG: hypothetical protein U9R08_02890 [Nanoarchaeota archaeon]|nr:hypothetical protein [Nanoarchaeota archaeon]